MNLYVISQTENNDYATFDSAVVCAADEEQARNTWPSNWSDAKWGYSFSCWCSSPDKVSVRLIGVAADDVPAGVVVASFNAG